MPLNASNPNIIRTKLPGGFCATIPSYFSLRVEGPFGFNKPLPLRGKNPYVGQGVVVHIVEWCGTGQS